MNYQNTLRGYYAPLLTEHPKDPWMAVGWGSKTGQDRRFEILRQAAEAAECRSILDVGCGIGDFCAHWPRNLYTGIDAVPEMVEAARIRWPRLSEFVECDLLAPPGLGERKFDAVIASGIFGLKIRPVYAERMIAAMWPYARKMLAFNMLSTCLPENEREDWEAHYDVSTVMAMAMQHTPFVRADHSYRLNDFTIFMYRDQQ